MYKPITYKMAGRYVWIFISIALISALLSWLSIYSEDIPDSYSFMSGVIAICCVLASAMLRLSIALQKYDGGTDDIIG